MIPPSDAAAAANNATPAAFRSQMSLYEGGGGGGADGGGGTINPYAGLSGKERKMAQRRCIAEDPEWNLAVVDRLTEICVRVIVNNFENRSDAVQTEKPQLSGVPDKYRQNVLSAISVNLPLSLGGPLIPDEAYWQRRALSRFRNCDTGRHGGSWKRLFFELHVQALAEGFIPKKDAGMDELSELEKELKMASPFLEGLHVRQMMPMQPPEGSVVKATDPHPDHVDMGLFFGALTNLKTLKLYYGVLDCGINFNWNVFGMTINDCAALCNSLKHNNVLRSLTIQMSGVDDDRIRLLASALLDNKTLEHLDVSHNKIGDPGARGLSKLLLSPHTALTTLSLANNRITRLGAQSLSRSLAVNTVLLDLNLRMNQLGDHGGAALCAGLGKGLATSKLRTLDLSSNGLGSETVAMLCALLRRNGKALTSLDVSCNRLGNCPGGGGAAAGGGVAGGSNTTFVAPVAPAAGMSVVGGRPMSGKAEGGDLAGKMLFEAISQNKYITHLDIRVTDLSPEFSMAIKGIVTENCQQ
ncbi:T-complex-associated testis-expressed protein 1 [Irineochytrium annulatum]|nr:T-complex-associated testis-expressed protein 1 [Irineochytrium annulatum]